MPNPENYKFTFHQDPGHGWLEVPRRLLHELGIQSRISQYSYVSGNKVYLEEDMDMQNFLEAWVEKYEEKPRMFEEHVNHSHGIRQYNRYMACSTQELDELDKTYGS